MIGNSTIWNLFQENHRQVMRITLNGQGMLNNVVYLVLPDGSEKPMTAVVMPDSSTYGTDDTRWGKYRGWIQTSDGPISITEADILQGGFTLDHYCFSTNYIELGSAIAAELTLKLKNTGKRFDEVSFEGVEMFVELGTKDWLTEDPVTYIPLGYFTVTEKPSNGGYLTVRALDRMSKLDRVVDWSLYTFPCTLAQFAAKTFEACGITCATTMTSLPNASYEITSGNISADSYRTLVRWIAFLTGTCAQFDENGRLRFRWFTQSSFEVSSANRYSHQLAENDVMLTGLVYVGADGTYTKGEAGYVVKFENCGILQNNVDAALTNIWNAVHGFTCRPYEASIRNAPFLQPLDMIKYIDEEGVSHNGMVSRITFTANKSTPISGMVATEQDAAWSPKTVYEEVTEHTNEAKKVATNYLSRDSTGIMVAELEDGNQTPSTATVKNVKIDSDSVDIRDGQTVLASFGEVSRIGKDTDAHVNIDYHSLKLIDKEGNVYMHVSDLRDQDGVADVSETFTGDGSNNWFTLKTDFYSVATTKVFVNDVDVTETCSIGVYGRQIGVFPTPEDGSEILITYKSEDVRQKAFTFGSRQSDSNIGMYSFAQGYQVVAAGEYSHAEGLETKAFFEGTHAEGYRTVAAKSHGAHAEGVASQALSNGTHAEGYKCKATNWSAHAEGEETTASGQYSHAEGQLTTASERNSHAEGYGTHASGEASHAEGQLTYADGKYSHAQGCGNTAYCDYQTVLGKYCKTDYDNKYAVIIGNGTENDSSDALEITWDGDGRFALDTTAQSGTLDGDLYAAITAKGLTSAIDGDNMVSLKKLLTGILNSL